MESEPTPVNWPIVALNIDEARGELNNLLDRISRQDFPDEVEFQIAMQHAYHHLNFAWNVRHESTDRYANLNQDDFQRWGEFPSDLHLVD